MTIAPAMAARLAPLTTTLCHAWLLTRADGARFGFTDHDRTLRIGDLDCEPHSGLNAAEARESAGLATDTTEISGALSSDRLVASDLLSGLYDGATVETLLVDWSAPENHTTLRTATIGKVRQADGAFSAELDSRSRAFDQPRGRYFRRDCDATLGDGRCRVDTGAPALRGEASVTAVDTAGGLSVSGLEGFAEGWFAEGLALVAPNLAARIVDDRIFGDSRRLALAFPLAIDVGAAIVVVAGCDKRLATCREKFANTLNFRGFPHLPGNDAVYAYATEDAVFDGAPLVP